MTEGGIFGEHLAGAEGRTGHYSRHFARGAVLLNPSTIRHALRAFCNSIVNLRASSILAAFQQELAKLGDDDDFDATIEVVEQDELQRRYEYAIEADNPSINFQLNLAERRFMHYEFAGTPVVIGALPLKECIRLPGIKDGTLFQKNVRQSLGTSNAVNKGIRQTIIGDNRANFFFSTYSIRSTTASTESLAGSSIRKETRWSSGNRPRRDEREAER